MVKIVTTVNGEKTEHEIEPGPRNFTCIVHQQGLRVDVPEFIEINPKNTIACMEAMNQKEWEWISTGPLFKTLFNLVFDEKNERNFGNCHIPKTIEELNQGDMGIAHVCGMIILGCESFMAGKSVFVRNPETYLHPSTERTIVRMFHKMMELFGVGGKVQTDIADEDAPENLKEPTIKKNVSDLVAENPNQTPAQLVVFWLSCMDQNKKFAQVGEKIYTVAEMTVEVMNETVIGKQLIEQFAQNNFKIKGKNV